MENIYLLLKIQDDVLDNIYISPNKEQLQFNNYFLYTVNTKDTDLCLFFTIFNVFISILTCRKGED